MISSLFVLFQLWKVSVYQGIELQANVLSQERLVSYSAKFNITTWSAIWKQNFLVCFHFHTMIYWPIKIGVIFKFLVRVVCHDTILGFFSIIVPQKNQNQSLYNTCSSHGIYVTHRSTIDEKYDYKLKGGGCFIEAISVISFLY